MKHSKLFIRFAKPVDYVMWYRILFRYISIPFILFFLKYKFKPNTISYISTFFRAIALYFYVTFNAIPAIIFFHIGFVIGSCDGTIARITNTTSEFGRRLDMYLDSFFMYAFYLVLIIAFYVNYESIAILILNLILCFLILIRRQINLINPFVNERDKFFFSRKKLNKNDSFQSNKEKLKLKFGFVSKVITITINSIVVLYPFIILFNLNYILLFYGVVIFTEIIKIFVDSKLTFNSI